MSATSALQMSQWCLRLFQVQTSVIHRDRLPVDTPAIAISNHRSFLDAPLMMVAMNRPIRFACHHYMGQVPLMRDLVTAWGCFPLESVQMRQQQFFHQASQFLQTRQVVGIFPEGAAPMVQYRSKRQVGKFQRGFAHLALRSSVPELAVVPIAIISEDEVVQSPIPVKLLSWFDPSEPLFQQDAWHPVVLYRQVTVAIGHPFWINASRRQAYQGKQAKEMVQEVSQYCYQEVTSLLEQGF